MDTDATQEELFLPLSSTTATMMFGDIGIAFSSHPEPQTIGILACIGLFCQQFTSLFLLPGLLTLMRRNSKKRKRNCIDRKMRIMRL